MLDTPDLECALSFYSTFFIFQGIMANFGLRAEDKAKSYQSKSPTGLDKILVPLFLKEKICFRLFLSFFQDVILR